MSNLDALIDSFRVPAQLAGATAPISRQSEDAACAGAVRTAQALFHHRRLRDRCFSADLFRDPAWDILLDLYVASELGRKISVSSACGASGVPTATGLRWLAKLEKLGAVVRIPDGADGRTVHVELTPATRDKMTGLLGRMALHPGSI